MTQEQVAQTRKQSDMSSIAVSRRRSHDTRTLRTHLQEQLRRSFESVCLQGKFRDEWECGFCRGKHEGSSYLLAVRQGWRQAASEREVSQRTSQTRTHATDATELHTAASLPTCSAAGQGKLHPCLLAYAHAHAISDRRATARSWRRSTQSSQAAAEQCCERAGHTKCSRSGNKANDAMTD